MLSMFSDLADTQEGASNPLEVRKRMDKIRTDEDKNGNWRDLAISQVFEDANSITITHWGISCCTLVGPVLQKRRQEDS